MSISIAYHPLPAIAERDLGMALNVVTGGMRRSQRGDLEALSFGDKVTRLIWLIWRC